MTTKLTNTFWISPNDKLKGKTPNDVLAAYVPLKTDQEIARLFTKLGLPLTTAQIIRRRKNHLNINKEIIPSEIVGCSAARSIVGESPFVKYDSPPVITSPRVIVMPDIQFPYHHHEFLNRVLNLCAALNIKTCIWGGDVIENSSLTHFDPNWSTEELINGGVTDEVANALIDMGNSLGKKVLEGIRDLLGKYGRKVSNNPAGVSEEWSYARREMQATLKQFDSIEWILGNHEGRILRQMESPFFAEDLRRLFVNEKVHISPYYYCEIISGSAKWRVTHPKSSGKGDARWYASKYLVNTIMCHNHQLIMQKDRSGTYWAIETGMMVDERRLPYVSQRDTKADMHLLGATFIIDGKPFLLYEDSPWDALKRLG